MLRRSSSLSALVVGLAIALSAQMAAAQASAGTKLLRFPDIHGSTVAFVYAGDIWTAPADGGLARRVTAHPGVELFPKFSPDGKWIAFTGQYEGDEQVYVVPVQGGEPRQLTFYPALGPLPQRWGFDNQVYGWTPDGKSVLFRSFRDTWDISDSRLYTVNVDGGPARVLPMPRAGAGSLSADGKRIVYSPLSRDFRTWKRYQGGWAQDLWLFDLTTHETSNLTHHPFSDRDPMWMSDRLYFASDRSGTLNLYSMDVSSAETPKQVTNSTTWDVRWPSEDAASGRIVYELGGELQVLDTKTGASKAISIQVPTDGLWDRPSRIAVADDIESFDLSPKGERVVFTARGDIFTAPIEHGVTRNLTRSSGTHDKWGAWSPDGRWIAFISDKTGEEELYVIAQDGSGEARQLTKGGDAHRFTPIWAPDSKRIAFFDKNGKLFVTTVADGATVEVADDPRFRIGGASWSHEGSHLAFNMNSDSGAGVASIYIWSAGDAKLHRVTGPLVNAFNPVFDAEGNYLFYLADRSFAPQISGIEWSFATNRTTDAFALALRKDVAHPLPPKSDEVTLEEEKKEEKPEAAEAGKKEKASKEKPKKADEPKADEAEKKPLKIDFDGLAERVARLPIESGNLTGLAANKGNLFYVTFGPFYYGRRSPERPALHVFSFEDRESKQLSSNMNGYVLSSDGNKLLVQEGDSYVLMDAKPGGDSNKKTVSTAGLEIDRIPAEEWREVFDEVWRRYRDYFYVANMHGYDWKAIGEQYRKLLPYVKHRSDLNYLLGEMVAELNVSHAYVSGGDWKQPDRPGVALPGARFELDSASNRYRISKIFRGANDEDRYRSPITEIGVDAKVGEYVLAIDGVELTPKVDPYKELRFKADRPVELTLNSKPSFEGARKVKFNPIDDEHSLIYLDWVTSNHERVSKVTNGRAGYLHIPDMGADGIREFIKWYYPQIRKEGLVIDVRGNGGGNVSPMIIERLSKKWLGTDFSRNDSTTGTYPSGAYVGSLVCLLSETSASDGDIFPYMFRQAGLGPLIGKRSWGGVVGISDYGPLVDGGSVSVPEGASGDNQGRWVIEGHGVDPDIEVDNAPKNLILGLDDQLERGIQELTQRMDASPNKLPKRPADPVRNKERYDRVPTLKNP